MALKYGGQQAMLHSLHVGARHPAAARSLHTANGNRPLMAEIF